VHVAATAALLVGITASASGQTFTVTTVADAGAGSLRQALLDAHAFNFSGQREIVFALPGGDVVAVQSPLPPITVPIRIDGVSPPDGSGVPGTALPIRVTLDGGGTIPVGLDVRASNVVVAGLAIVRFGIGVRIAGAVSMVRVESASVGADASGTQARGNGVGIAIVEDGGVPTDISIGGSLTGGGSNLISGNGDGILVAATASRVFISGNRIGTNASTLAALPNGRGIVFAGPGVPGPGHSIGSFSGNVIAGNSGPGIALLHSTGVAIDGNYIGVNTSEHPVGNAGDGIVLGDHASGMSATSTRVIGNLIASNGRNGIVVRQGSANQLASNRIWSNGLFGIDLGDDGVDVSDDGDGDEGPNGRQNAPVLRPSSWLLVEATLHSKPSTQFTSTFFASRGCDPSDHGEAELLRTEGYPQTDATGRAEFNLAGTLPPGYTAVTAVVTSESDGTSEYSNCVVLNQPTGTLSGIVTFEGAPLAGVRVRLGGAVKAERVTGPDGLYSFANLPLGSSYQLDALHDDYAFSPAGVSTGLITPVQTQNFAARRTLTLSGRINDIDDGSMEGVTVSLAGERAGDVTTDADGWYRFSGLPIGGSFTVMPSKLGYTFSPAIRSHANLAQSPSPAEGGFSVVSGTFTRYLAEGATSAFFDTQIELLNTTTTDTVARLDFLLSGGTTITHAAPVKARSRATIRPATIDGLEWAEFSTVIQSPTPLSVDRTMTWDGTAFGSHAETAISAPATRWYLAEGATIAGFNLFYLLQNPSPFAVSAIVTYLLPSAPPLRKVYVLPPLSRTNIWVNQDDPRLASAEVSAVIDASRPIIVERSMYRDVPGQVFGAGHASAGVTQARTRWFLAEGNTGPYFDLFVLVANPSLTPAPITATFLLPDGSTRTKDYVVPAESRFTIWLDEEELPSGSGLKPLANTAVSTTITSTADVPIIVERSMWWPGNGATWHEGHNSPAAGFTGTRWAIAGGQTGGPRDVETYLLVANTAAEPGTAIVTLFFEDGTTAERTFPLRPTSRLNVAVAAEFPESHGRSYGATVESVGSVPAPVIVERATYSSAGGRTWAAGSATLATRIR
jgi:hypothetical protein